MNSNSRNTPEVLIPNVTEEQMHKLVETFRKEGASITGSNVGLVENECFAAKFEYDPASKLLTLEPHRLVDSLTPRQIRRTVLHLIAPPNPPTILESGDEIYMPDPYSCATYNWVIGFLTNNSGTELYYSGATTTTHGYIDGTPVAVVNNNDTPATHKDGYWTNKESKDSSAGCAGITVYQFRDGVTTVNITYWNNGSGSTQATAAAQGQNMARYAVTCTNYTKWHGGSAAYFLYPYVTVSLR